VKRLVWYEHHHTMESAILRETRIKKWRRAWKLDLIERFNPEWNDLHDPINPFATLVREEAPPHGFPLSRE
jgi:putative endonuclease